jgi:hypothetical protein
VLELDHMPAGMELFPAADDSAWQLIKDVIDASDYYVLIIGGRYGSLDEEGIGYTEKEYDYAVGNGKPVIACLHRNPDNLPRGKTETDEEGWKKLQAFRSKVEDRHTCAYWTTASELKSHVITGIIGESKKHPAIGWIRADQAPSDQLVGDLLEAREKISELEKKLKATRSEPPPGTEGLMQGDDEFALSVQFEARPPGEFFGPKYSASIRPTWNEIFAGVAPVLISDCKENQLHGAFRVFVKSYCSEAFSEDANIVGKQIDAVQVEHSEILTTIVQLRALGLISESQKKRSIRDSDTYWQLTPYGDQVMVRLRALYKEPPSQKATGEAMLADQGE